MKKRGNMKIKNFEAFAKRVAQKLDTTIVRVSSDAIWFANYYYINFDGEFIYIADYSKDTPRKVMCSFIYIYNTQKDFFHDLDMIAIKEAVESGKPEEPEETEETAEKHYADYTAEDFIKAGIAKECTTCPDFCKEDCIENAECARGNDVFDGCKTVKEVMEVKQELNARFGKEQMKAINNPNWHTVKLAIVNSNDFVRLNEKLKLYISVYRDLKQTILYLRKCKTQDTYDTCFVRYIKRINAIYANGKISDAMLNFVRIKLSMQNVESGVWASACEDSTGYHESRRYNKSRIDL